MAQRKSAKLAPGTGRRGPRPSGGTPDQKSTISVRISPELKEQLFAATQANDRSLSAEAELRLERTFSDEKGIETALELAYGRQVAGLVLVIARVMADAGRLADLSRRAADPAHARQDWFNDPWEFDEAARAVSQLLKAFRPLGEVVQPERIPLPTRLEAFAEAMLNPGHNAAELIRNALSGRSLSSELTDWAARRRHQLGQLVERLNQKTD